MSTLPIIETVVNLIVAVLTWGGLPALFLLMVVESFGIPPLPSEVILPFAGFLVAGGAYSLPEAIVAAVAGGVVGAYAAYLVGRYGRHWLTAGPRWLRLEERHLARMDRWFTDRGEGTVLVARLLPVVRSYVSYPAGTARMEPVRFGVYTALGATPFAAAFIYAGVLLGANWSSIVPIFQAIDDVALVLVAVVVVYGLLRWQGRLTGGFPPRWIRRTPADGATPTGPAP